MSGKEEEFLLFRALAIEKMLADHDFLARLLVNVLSKYPDNPQRGVAVFDEILKEIIRQRKNTLNIIDSIAERKGRV